MMDQLLDSVQGAFAVRWRHWEDLETPPLSPATRLLGKACVLISGMFVVALAGVLAWHIG